MEPTDLNNRFAFHPARDQQTQDRHAAVRSACLSLADELDGLLPDSREKSTAITKLEEVTFWANAAIARHDTEGVRRIK